MRETNQDTTSTRKMRHICSSSGHSLEMLILFNRILTVIDAGKEDLSTCLGDMLCLYPSCNLAGRIFAVKLTVIPLHENVLDLIVGHSV